MDAAEHQALRDRADDLDVGEEALEVYTRLLDLDPDDSAAANMIGRSLQHLGRTEEAAAHWRFVAELQPGNEIARNRVRSTKPARESVQVTTSRPSHPTRAAGEVVDGALRGDEDHGALRFMAASIAQIEKLDPARLSVTEHMGGARLSIYGGREVAVVPARGMLNVRVHQPAVSRDLVEASEGLDVVIASSSLLPDSVEYRVPFADAGRLSALLLAPHREHLRRSIAEGPPPWKHGHDGKLRDYILKTAAASAR